MTTEYMQELKSYVHDVIDEIHTALPGTINDFDAAACTATITPDGNFRNKDGSKIPFPVINAVPVIFPCAGGTGIAFPVNRGDKCLLLFSEQSPDPNADLRYDLSNAIAIVGMFGTPSALVREAQGSGMTIVAQGNARVAIGNGLVSITGNVRISGNLSVSGNINGSNLPCSNCVR